MNSVVGAGTLITFPVLLFLGLPPVVANVSSTVGLVSGSVAGAYGYRATLVGRGPLVRRLMLVSFVGGTAGGLLLVLLPPVAFERIVPVLLVASAALAALQPRIATAVRSRRTRGTAADRTGASDAAGGTDERFTGVLGLGVFAATVYGGYFGAALGVVLLVLLGILVGGSMNDLNGIKNVLSATTNLVAAVLFAGLCYCAASGSMVLLNKRALSSYDFSAPNALLAVQCALAVALAGAALAAGVGIVRERRSRPIDPAELWLPERPERGA
jgi:uncharacterized membrane protein YfcA